MPNSGLLFLAASTARPDDTQKLASAGLRGQELPPHPHVHVLQQYSLRGWPLLAPAWHSHLLSSGRPSWNTGDRGRYLHVTCRTVFTATPLNSLSGGETEAQSNSPEATASCPPDLQPHWAGCRALPPDLRLLKALSVYSNLTLCGSLHKTATAFNSYELLHLVSSCANRPALFSGEDGSPTLDVARATSLCLLPTLATQPPSPPSHPLLSSEPDCAAAISMCQPPAHIWVRGPLECPLTQYSAQVRVLGGGTARPPLGASIPRRFGSPGNVEFLYLPSTLPARQASLPPSHAGQGSSPTKETSHSWVGRGWERGSRLCTAWPRPRPSPASSHLPQAHIHLG